MLVAEIRGLTVAYGQVVALQDFSADVPEGCVGLLGPNGAGKTTLIKTLLGFVTPVAGHGAVLGADIRREAQLIRQRVGLMPEQDCHIPGISAVSYVAFAGELAGMPGNEALRRAHEVLEYCGLGEARYRNVETFSTGMKQRIKLAQALVHGPSLLLLDEPTNGLDPRGRTEMLELIRSISHGKGVNVLVSSHLLPDIERICDEVIVVFEGRLQAAGKIADLKRMEGMAFDVELREPSAAFANAIGMLGGRLLYADSERYRVQLPGTPQQVGALILKAATESKAQLRGFRMAERSLEEAFLEAIR
jgi:ABC-2 type transport system ATP-binding protein